jgi:hypothetical protein
MPMEYQTVTSDEAGHHQVVCLRQSYSSLQSKISKQCNLVLPLQLPISLRFLKVIRYLLRSSSPTIKPSRCTSFSNLFYLGIIFYVFRTAFPFIIMGSRLYIQQQVKAGSSICLTFICCCMYSLELLMMDGKTVRNM